MVELLIDNAFTYGIFAGLFVWLLYTTNKRNECRESMYQNTIRKNQEIISEQAKAFGGLSSDVSEIKEILRRNNH